MSSMDACILGIQKTIEAATHSAIALAEASKHATSRNFRRQVSLGDKEPKKHELIEWLWQRKAHRPAPYAADGNRLRKRFSVRWNGQRQEQFPPDDRWDANRRDFRAERESWVREREELNSQMIEKDRAVEAHKKEIRRLANHSARLFALLNSHLESGCTWCEGVGGVGAGARGSGNGGESCGDGICSKRRESTAATSSGTALDVVIPPVASSGTTTFRTKDYRRPKSHDSVDEVATPTAGPGPVGQPIRRRHGTLHAWPGVGGTVSVAGNREQGDMAGRGVSQQLRPAEEEGRPDGARQYESDKNERTITEDRDALQREPGSSVGSERRDKEHNAGRVAGTPPNCLEAGYEAGRQAGADIRRENRGGGMRETQHKDRNNDVISRGNKTSSATGTLCNEISRKLSVSRSSSGRKRSRLALGEMHERHLNEEGGNGGSRTGRELHGGGNSRTVVMEMPQERRRSWVGRGQTSCQQQGTFNNRGQAAPIRTGNGESRRSVSRIELQQNTNSVSRCPETSRRSDSANSGTAGIRTERRSSEAGGWMQPGELDTRPLSTLYPVGASRQGHHPAGLTNRHRSKSGTSLFNSGTEESTGVSKCEPARAKHGRDDSDPKVAALTVPLGPSAGENQTIGERGPDRMEGGGSEAAAIYPQLTTAVVSPKTQKTKPRHRHRESSEVAHSRSKSPPVESRWREGKASSAENDGNGASSRAKREGTSDGSDKFNGKHVGMVGNPYHPAEKGVGRGGIDGLAADKPRLPKPYKFQEVVRDRAKRAAMKGHDCEHCIAYLEAVGGSPGERQAMLNMCSRHKHDEANGRPAETPDGFWELSFADSISRREQEGPPLPSGRRQQDPHSQPSRKF